MTLVEVMIATVVMAVAVGGLASAVVSSARLAQVNEETALAHDLARRIAGEIQAVPFDEIWATFNGDVFDDPDGKGTAAGNNFAADAFAVQDEDEDGFVGQVLFPAVEVAEGDFELHENVVDGDLGMPRDLNGDGLIEDKVDRGDDYLVLPVTIRVQWRGVTGNRTHDLHLLLLE